MTAAPVVIGLDLSLTCTGVAGVGWTDHVRTKTRGDERLVFLKTQIVSFIRCADYVAMEGPSYGHTGPRAHEDLAGLRVLVRDYCWRHRIPYAVVPPSSLKLFVTGSGRATKGEVRSAVADRFGVHTEGAARYDEADAYAVMAAGYALLGFPLAAPPARGVDALQAVSWVCPGA